VLTVSNDEDLAIRSLHEGAQDYLPKAQINGALIWRALRYAMERQRVQLELLNLSLIDELTGLNNRRGFLALGEHHVKLASRSGMPFMVAFVDLDNLKKINDTFGHQEGNRALVEAANVLRTLAVGLTSFPGLAGMSLRSSLPMWTKTAPTWFFAESRRNWILAMPAQAAATRFLSA